MNSVAGRGEFNQDPATPARSYAEVAELADALHSGCSSRQGVEVRVLSSAPYLSSYLLHMNTDGIESNSLSSLVERTSRKPIGSAGLQAGILTSITMPA